MSGYTVAAFYRFAPIADPDGLRLTLLARCRELGLCGTILVAEEGLNGTIAGTAAAIGTIQGELEAIPGCADLPWKLSTATTAPFRKLLIKRKREIVTMGVPELPIAGHTGTYVPPAEWDALIARDDVLLVDTRNDYELAEGAFVGAVNPQIANFRAFPAWVDAHLGNDRERPVAMYCTGGIRCEKATALLKARGFRHVYHLQGGILGYLAQTGNARQAWQGTCYVFDERETVDARLQAAPRTNDETLPLHQS